MTDLIEKVHEAIRDAEGGLDKAEARAAILAVLDHFSEPGSVTDEMAYQAWGEHDNGVGIDWEETQKEVIAAAMRAARDEVSRDK